MEGGREEGRSHSEVSWGLIAIESGKRNAISVQEKKIAAGENLERTRRIELLESSILDEQEKNC